MKSSTLPNADCEGRFWSKVAIRGPDDCWLWLAGTHSTGTVYGQFWLEGARHGAHRIAWRLTRGPVPEKLNVLHRCDTPLCVNPGHLFLGTNLENAADREAKGRGVIITGERHGMSKLSESDVLEIRSAHESGRISKSALSRDYGVHWMTIDAIVRYRTWKHVGLV